jgi:HAD superfamily hydrolase (TIGR01490 family)
MRIAAFFDIDHTLIAADSGVLFVRFMVQKGLMRRRDLLGPAYYTVLYRLNRLDVDSVFQRYQEQIRGRRHDEMSSLCAEWFPRMVRPSIYPAMAELLQRHRQAGHVVAFLSSATTYVAEPLARELSIEHLLVNRLIVEDGQLTGTAVQPLCWGEGKRYWAERFAAEQSIDLGSSYFYSDSITDIPVLSLVGQPRAVNPDRLLRRHARRQGWPILTVTHQTESLELR